MNPATCVPLVEYLDLGPPPRLMSHECTSCGARYFDRRIACADCSGSAFEQKEISNAGEVRAFTIVSLAAPGIPVPFVAAVVDCDGTTVRGNIVDVPPDPDHVHVGMKVELTTFPIGKDASGIEAIGFGYRPTEE